MVGGKIGGEEERNKELVLGKDVEEEKGFSRRWDPYKCHTQEENF